MVEAARRRTAVSDCRLQRSKRQIGVDPPACGPAHRPARPGVQDHRASPATALADLGFARWQQLLGAKLMTRHPARTLQASGRSRRRNARARCRARLIQARAGAQVLLGHSPLEFDGVGPIPGHPLSPCDPLSLRSISSIAPVRPPGVSPNPLPLLVELASPSDIAGANVRPVSNKLRPYGNVRP
jgi:hypothetical protein